MESRLSNAAWTVAVLLGTLLAAQGRAHAYIDPGTGSYIFQIIIATLLGAGFMIKVYWRKLVRLITRRKPDDDDEDQ